MKSALGSSLIEQFCMRSVESRGPFGGLWATISVISVPQDETAIRIQMEEAKSRLVSSEGKAAVGAALSVMELAFQEKACLVPGLSDGLLTMLTKDAPSAHAAAWALAWLNHERMGTNAWQPSVKEMEQIISSVGDAQFDSEAARYLTWILDRERDERAVDALIFRLGDINVRATAVSALGQIGNQTAINALIPYLEDDDSEVRRVVLSTLASTLEDETERILLSRHLDNQPYLDPREEIDEQRVRKASESLKLSTEEIRYRYEMIARKFPLRLNFESSRQDQQ